MGVRKRSGKRHCTGIFQIKIVARAERPQAVAVSTLLRHANRDQRTGPGRIEKQGSEDTQVYDTRDAVTVEIGGVVRLVKLCPEQSQIQRVNNAIIVKIGVTAIAKAVTVYVKLAIIVERHAVVDGIVDRIIVRGASRCCQQNRLNGHEGIIADNG